MLERQLIVGQSVTQETNYKKQLTPMITTIAHQSGITPPQLLADAGYCSDTNLTAIADTTIDAYISTWKQKHGERPGPCPRAFAAATAARVRARMIARSYSAKQSMICLISRDDGSFSGAPTRACPLSDTTHCRATPAMTG